MFLVSQNGSTSILHVDTEKQELRLIRFEDDIYIHSLSMNEDSTLAFSYIEKGGLFTKYGEYDPAEGTYRLSGDNFKGGVYYPVKDRDGIIYYVSSYVYGKKVSRIEAASLTFGEEMSVREDEFVPSLSSYSLSSLEKRRYNPLEFMRKGVLLPVSGTQGLYLPELTGLGLTATNIDPTEKHTFTASIGYAFEQKTPTMMVGYSYSDCFSTTFSAFNEGSSTSFEWDITGKWTRNLGAYNRNIILSDTLALFSLKGETGLSTASLSSTRISASRERDAGLCSAGRGGSAREHLAVCRTLPLSSAPHSNREYTPSQLQSSAQALCRCL